MTEYTSSASAQGHTHTTTLDNKIINDTTEVSEFIPTKKIQDNLVATYIGINTVKFELEDADKIDLENKQYFGVSLKEKSLENALKGTNSHKEAYKQFYSELLFEPVKKSKISSFLNTFKETKLLEEDNQFFNNLNAIASYMRGETVEDIEAKVNAVIEHRDIYLSKIPVAQEIIQPPINNLKNKIIIQRYNNSIVEFAKLAEKNTGTVYMCQVIDSFITDAMNSFRDFRSEFPENYKQALFNGAFTEEYNQIISNTDIADKEAVKQKFKDLHKKMFGIN